MTRHAGEFITDPFPESFLAVDLFFVLSGFVIAHSYESRLERGRFLRSFVLLRLIRLYPLYLAGLLLGLLVEARANPSNVTGVAGLLNVALAIVMLDRLFNGPTWSLLPELAANIV